MPESAARIESRPVAWEITRKGGYIRAGGDGVVRFATIERRGQGYTIRFHDDRVSEALMALDEWDGSGSDGPWFPTRARATEAATRAVQYVLDMAWARDDAEQEVEARYGRAT